PCSQTSKLARPQTINPRILKKIPISATVASVITSPIQHSRIQKIYHISFPHSKYSTSHHSSLASIILCAPNANFCRKQEKTFTPRRVAKHVPVSREQVSSPAGPVAVQLLERVSGLVASAPKIAQRWRN
ncbi:hypothetical protein M758_8G139600, partial [Ceratodon purpureus]